MGNIGPLGTVVENDGLYRIKVSLQYANTPDAGYFLFDSITIYGNSTYLVEGTTDPYLHMRVWGKYYDSELNEPLTAKAVILKDNATRTTYGAANTDGTGTYVISCDSMPYDTTIYDLDYYYSEGVSFRHTFTLDDMTYLNGVYYANINYGNHEEINHGTTQEEIPDAPIGSYNPVEWFDYIAKLISYIYTNTIAYIVGIYNNTAAGIGTAVNQTVGNITFEGIIEDPTEAYNAMIDATMENQINGVDNAFAQPYSYLDQITTAIDNTTASTTGQNGTATQYAQIIQSFASIISAIPLKVQGLITYALSWMVILTLLNR